MDQNSPDNGLRVLLRKVALEKAIELSAAQAHEIWRVMQIVLTGESFKGLAGAAVHYAMNFHQIPDAWKVIEEKALVYERNIGNANS